MTKLNRWHGNFDLKIFKIKQGRTSFALLWLMLEFQLKPVTVERAGCRVWVSPCDTAAHYTIGSGLSKVIEIPAYKKFGYTLKSPFHAFSRVNAQSNARRETHFTLRASPKRFCVHWPRYRKWIWLKISRELAPDRAWANLEKKIIQNSREQKKWIFKNNKINSRPLCLETKNLPATCSK